MASVVGSGIPGFVDDVDTAPVGTPRRILVVDDVPANLVAMEAALAPLGRGVVCVESGRAALTRLLEEDFALILLDVQMPDMDGLETAELIRSRKRTRHVPIIFVTAYLADSTLVRRAYALGAVDFLFKPIEPQILIAKVTVFVTLQLQAEALASERLRRDLDTARREYEEEARAQQLEILAEEDRRKDRFLAVLSHELRNPLAPIRTIVDLLVEDPRREITDKMLEILDAQTTKMTRLVNDLLDMSRIKADRLVLERGIVDLRTIVRAAVDTASPVISERGHNLVLSIPEQPVPVDADPTRIEQVITNLMTNAARYTDLGGRIEVTCGHRQDTAFVSVADNGIGIAKQMLPTVFDMFVQERARQDGSGGLGLGLALSRRLAEMHGGTLTAHSEGRDRGSRFVMELPLNDRPIAAAGSPTAVTGPTPPLRVVVVEDHADIRELIARLLTKHGHDVAVAADAASGLELIAAQRPDIAIIDLGLPDMDGVELAHTLRARCPDLRTRLIAVTGYGQPGDVERTRAAGFAAHLTKPVAAAQLLDILAG